MNYFTTGERYMFAAQADAGDAVATARLYDSAPCRAAIARSNFSAWQQLLGPLGFHNKFMNWPFLKYPLQDLTSCCCAESSRNCIHYVHNPKAGSKFMSAPEGLAHYLTGRSSQQPQHSVASSSSSSCAWRCVSPERARAWRLGTGGKWPRSGEFAFTTVREPISAAISAYHEVQRKQLPSEHEHDPHWRGYTPRNASAWPPAYLQLPCTTREERTARFEAFIDTMMRGDAIGREGFHSWPQALKVNYPTRVPARYDAIVRLEQLDSGMSQLATLLNVSFHAAHASESLRHSTSRGAETDSRHYSECADVDVACCDGRLLRKLCALYASDFACLGYRLPAACLPVPLVPGGAVVKGDEDAVPGADLAERKEDDAHAVSEPDPDMAEPRP